jgi:predicted aspartyl protease
VPVRIFKATPGQALAIVQVTLQDGKHYPFVIDTGASATSVSRRLARTVGYATVGKTKLSSVNKVAAAPIVAVKKWAIRGVALPATIATVTDLPVSKAGYVGLLGGDVLATFGSIRLNYRLSRLTIGPPLTGSADCTGAPQVTSPTDSRAPDGSVDK